MKTRTIVLVAILIAFAGLSVAIGIDQIRMRDAAISKLAQKAKREETLRKISEGNVRAAAVLNDGKNLMGEMDELKEVLAEIPVLEKRLSELKQRTPQGIDAQADHMQDLADLVNRINTGKAKLERLRQKGESRAEASGK